MENDIAKCDNEKCPLKDACFRYTSKPDEYQTYFIEMKPKDGKCEYFLAVSYTLGDGHFDTDEI